jgi:hemerythrin
MLESKTFLLPETFLLPHDEIDQEHQDIVDTLNEWEKMLSGSTVDELLAQFEKFISQLQNHFKNEEEYMRQVAYDGLEWHSVHHKDTLNEAMTMLDSCRQSNDVDKDQIYHCFYTLFHDIAKADLKFGEFLRSKKQA